MRIPVTRLPRLATIAGDFPVVSRAVLVNGAVENLCAENYNRFGLLIGSGANFGGVAINTNPAMGASEGIPLGGGETYIYLNARDHPGLVAMAWYANSMAAETVTVWEILYEPLVK
jgi:hypothetical protein